jgi:transcriptional regulator of acetoin/glycerol metabolism
LSEQLRDPERAALITALEQHGWNRSKTAKALGIDRTTLYRKMRDLGLGRYGQAG